MFKDILENINYIEGLYVYGSGELDQLSPINENIEEDKKIFETAIPRKVPLHFISQTETIKLIKCTINATIILSTEGNVYSFGSADNGALGHKESINALHIPLTFPATGISGGDCHGIAYNRENLAFWGQFRNSKKNLGRPYYNPTYFNKTHIKGEFFKKAISGTNHVVILSEKKNVFCFGSNEFGQIGASPEKQIHYFQMNKLYEKDVEDIFTGHEHSFLTKNEGGVRILKGWGNNGNGQIGTGSFATRINENFILYVPTKVIFPEISKISVKKVEGGSSSTLCLTEDNRIFVWGENDFSLLGLQIKDKIVPRPKEITFFNPYSNPNNTVNDIFANNQYFYAKNSKTNKIYSWGVGINYQLGNRKTKDENTPYLINYLFFKNLYVNKLSLGYSHVAVFLTEKKNKILNYNLEQFKNNENNNSEKHENNNNKPNKRKSDELPNGSIKEENDNYEFLIKVKEEYITLNEFDQPKKSIKKLSTEKKIMKKSKKNESKDGKNIEKEKEEDTWIDIKSKSNIFFEKNKNKKGNEKSNKSPIKKKKSFQENEKKNHKKESSNKKEKENINYDDEESYKKEEKINENNSSKSNKRKSYSSKINENEKSRRKTYPKKEEEKKEEKSDKKDRLKEKTQSKNKNKKTDNKEEDKKDKQNAKLDSNRHKISLSKENNEEDKKAKSRKKQSKTKNNKNSKEAKSLNEDVNGNFDKVKEEKKSKKNSSSKKNKKSRTEDKEGKEDEVNNENSENNSWKKISCLKRVRTPEKKEGSRVKSKAKNTKEKSKKKKLSKSKEKYPKRK